MLSRVQQKLKIGSKELETYFPTNTQHIPNSELQPGGGDAGNRKEIENCLSLEHLVRSSSELSGSCLALNWIIYLHKRTTMSGCYYFVFLLNVEYVINSSWKYFLAISNSS